MDDPSGAEPMGQAPSRLLEKRKIGISGSSKDLSPAMRDFSRAVGRCLAETGQVYIVSGGTKQRKDAAPGDFAVDWHVADAAVAALAARQLDIEEHLATVPRHDPFGFQLGRAWPVRGKTGETRRFAFVRRLDGLIAIGGGRGTDQELALAIELGIPVLPVPTFPGRGKTPLGARKYWDAYREELVAKLKIDAAEAARWEAPAQADIESLARRMATVFLRSLARRCFVIMPFADDHAPLYTQVIGPAVERVGDRAVNLKDLGLVGDAVRHVLDGIRTCDYVIAVLDDLRLNVLYELGLAHGQGKPAVLISRRGATEGQDLPFDIATQNRLEYETIDVALRDRLVGVLKRSLDER
jgi:predicted Rossmann-fold nucleotide-binding protein